MKRAITFLLGLLLLISLAAATVNIRDNYNFRQYNLSNAENISADVFCVGGSCVTDFDDIGSGNITGIGVQDTLVLWSNSSGITNTTITYNGSKYSVVGVVSIVDTDSGSNPFHRGLMLHTDDSQTGTAITWVANPDVDATDRSSLIAQDTAHGPLSGQDNWERAWYFVENSTGNFTMVNAMKYLSHINQSSNDANFILTGLKGITALDTIRIGQGVLDLNNVSAQFYRYAKFFNGFGIIIQDSTGTERTALVLDSSDDLFVKNEAIGGDVVLQNRDGSNVLTTRLRLRSGDDPDIDLVSANLDMNDNNILNLDFVSGSPTFTENVTFEAAAGGVRYVQQDNGSDIQAAINECPESGCSIFVPQGTYSVTDYINISKDNIWIRGAGNETNIQCASADNTTGCFMIKDRHASNIVLEDMRIEADGIGSGVLISSDTSYGIHNVWLNRLTITNVNFTGIHAKGVYDLWITDSDIFGVLDEHAIYLRRVKECTVMGNRLYNTTQNGIWGASIKDCTLAFNEIELSGSQAIQVGGANNTAIIGNNIKNASSYGISVTTDGATQSGDVRVEGNDVDETENSGIRVTATFGATVNNNVIRKAGNECIKINANHVTVVGNVMRICADNGIDFGGSAAYGSASANQVYQSTATQVYINNSAQFIDVSHWGSISGTGTSSTIYKRSAGLHNFSGTIITDAVDAIINRSNVVNFYNPCSDVSPYHFMQGENQTHIFCARAGNVSANGSSGAIAMFNSENTLVNSSLTEGFNITSTKNVTIYGILKLVDTAPDGAQDKGLVMHSDGLEKGTAIVFWDSPPEYKNRTDHLIGQITGHGNDTGDMNNEIGIYTTKSDGQLSVRARFPAQVDDAPFIFSSSNPGIAHNVGGDITLGYCWYGCSDIIFGEDAEFKNNFGLYWNTSAGTMTEILVLDTKDNLSLKNTNLDVNDNDLVDVGGVYIGGGLFMESTADNDINISQDSSNDRSNNLFFSESNYAWALRSSSEDFEIVDWISGATPFEIKAGAPTASLLIGDGGNVSFNTDDLYVDAIGHFIGIDTATPGRKLDVNAGTASDGIRVSGTNGPWMVVNNTDNRGSAALYLYRGTEGKEQAGIYMGTSPATASWFAGMPYNGGGATTRYIIGPTRDQSSAYLSITNTGETLVSGVSAETGQVVCVTSTGALGTCTSDINATGGCTCA